MVILGSHNDLVSPKYLLGSVQKALFNNANALMVYSGAPQNTHRKPISIFKVKEAHALMQQHHIALEHLFIHAPYIINLGNCEKSETFEIAKRVLSDEIQRCNDMGAKYLILHPGSCLKASKQEGISRIVEGLNDVLKEEQNVIVLLETMAGKGSEIGACFEELASIINQVELKHLLGVCMDTCHLNDAGYDLKEFDNILADFERIIGLDNLKCIHINDSKNEKGAKKDRHENIGFGTIGFDTLCTIIHHPRLSQIAKILETPYINKKIAPYKVEIQMLRNKKFEANWIEIKANISALEE